VRDEEIFLANYSDGLSDVDLNDMLDRFKKSGKLACFLATRPPLTYHIVDMDSEGGVRGMRAWDRADVWINSGFFLLRPKIFEFMQDGEELVVEPFERLAKIGPARAALDRIEIPQDIIDRISEVISPGSSLIISDEGMSTETGEDTDFVILMSGEPQGAIKMRRHDPNLYGRYDRQFDRSYGRSPAYAPSFYGGNAFIRW
jgi:hypothetical protein